MRSVNSLGALALSLFTLACGTATTPVAGGHGADAGTVDAGCPAMDLTDGGCTALTFARLCDVTRITVLQTGVLSDDAAALRMGTSLTACLPAPTTTIVDTRDGGGGVLDANGQPLAARTETFIAAGGSFGQPFVSWYESTGRSPVSDTSTATVSSLSYAGSVIFTEPTANLGPSLDYFTLEFVRTAPTGPLSVIGYGFYAPGTVAAAWYFEHRVVAQRGFANANWYVVRWNDLDGDLLPGEADQFTVLRSGT